ncbi:hypothetical protein DYB32_004404 [Aphanomyces invadans]|uniref:START domain-containing protein n=1 Tax=Aphanomyces invadans TaxID=157072 RepID=A0A418AXL0_9STRA|nr:hypothetical protein DYB32_004404 [Aphanomyces invadans]
MKSKHGSQSYPRIEFTQDVYEKHLANMERIAALALNGRSGWDKATATPAHGWTLLTDTMGWEVLSLKAQCPSVHEYLCLGTLRTSLAALQEAFYVKNTYEFRALSAVLYEDAIADAALLNITHRRTSDDLGQFFGVKYLRLLVQVMNEEDQEQEYIYLEFSGTRMDSRGRKTWFVVTEPVAIKSKADAKSSMSSTTCRGSQDSDVGGLSFGERCSCVKLYREVSDGNVEVTVRTKLEAGSSFFKSTLDCIRWRPTCFVLDDVLVSHLTLDACVAAMGAGSHHHHHHHQSANLSGSVASMAKRAGPLVFWKSMGMFIPSGLAKDLLSLAVEKFCKSCLVQAKIDSMRHRDVDAGSSRISDDSSSSAVNSSDANHRIAYLHSPACNANGDHFFLSDLVSNSSLSLSHTSDPAVAYDYTLEVDSGPFKPPVYTPSAASTTSTRYAPAFPMVSKDLADYYDLPVHRHAPQVPPQPTDHYKHIPSDRHAAQGHPLARGIHSQDSAPVVDAPKAQYTHVPRPQPSQPQHRFHPASDDLSSSQFHMVKLVPTDGHTDPETTMGRHVDYLVGQSSKEPTTEQPRHHRHNRPPMSTRQQRY